jgi:DNA repair ATPase RecN
MGAPVKNTCPQIDKAIAKLKEVEKECDYDNFSLGDCEDEDTLRDHCKELRESLDYIYQLVSDPQSILEDLRDANGSLRDWGEELEKEKQELLDRIEDLENS